eukprot:5305352-Prymnesium_polylepis.1
MQGANIVVELDKRAGASSESVAAQQQPLGDVIARGVRGCQGAGSAVARGGRGAVGHRSDEEEGM